METIVRHQDKWSGFCTDAGQAIHQKGSKVLAWGKNRLAALTLLDLAFLKIMVLSLVVAISTCHDKALKPLRAVLLGLSLAISLYMLWKVLVGHDE